MAKYGGSKKEKNRTGGNRKKFSEKNGIHGDSQNHSQNEKGNQRNI